MRLTEVLQQYSFLELWIPLPLLMAVLLLSGYAMLLGPLRRRFFPDQSWGSIGNIICFVLGVAAFYFAQGTPLDVLGHRYLFSAHMLQMALMYMVVPPLLIKGLPTWVWRQIFQSEKAKKILSVMTFPIVTLVLFNLLFAFYHHPIIFDFVMSNYYLHMVYHTILTTSAFFMWWPLLCPLPELDRLSELKKLAYIISGSILITPVCALVVFAPSVLYDTYSQAPQIFSLLDSRNDQQLGGVLMKLIQETAYGTGLLIIFLSWVRKERSKDAVDPVETRFDVDDADVETNTARGMVPHPSTGHDK